MNSTDDISRLCALAETLQEAKEKVAELMARLCADYMIMSLKDGEQLIVRSAGNQLAKSAGA